MVVSSTTLVAIAAQMILLLPFSVVIIGRAEINSQPYLSAIVLLSYQKRNMSILSDRSVPSNHGLQSVALTSRAELTRLSFFMKGCKDVILHGGLQGCHCSWRVARLCPPL